MNSSHRFPPQQGSERAVRGFVWWRWSLLEISYLRGSSSIQCFQTYLRLSLRHGVPTWANQRRAARRPVRMPPKCRHSRSNALLVVMWREPFVIIIYYLIFMYNMMLITMFIKAFTSVILVVLNLYWQYDDLYWLCWCKDTFIMNKLVILGSQP